LSATAGTFNTGSASGEERDSPEFKTLLNEVHKRANETGLERCTLGNAQSVSDAVWTIAHGMHALHAEGELLLPHDTDPSLPLNTTAYRARNELLHEKMMHVEFDSILAGDNVSFTDNGDIVARYVGERVVGASDAQHLPKL
jgi:hypothetical protein